jgi:hypothetical protein
VIGAAPHERSKSCTAQRDGYRTRTLSTAAGSLFDSALRPTGSMPSPVTADARTGRRRSRSLYNGASTYL